MSQANLPSQPDHDCDRLAFVEAMRASLAAGTFLKATLGKYRASTTTADARAPTSAARCTITRVLLKGASRLRCVTREGAQEITHNFEFERGLDHLAQLICNDYLSATLFTVTGDVSLVYSRKRVPHLTRSKPTLTEAPPTDHDRAKAYLVDPSAPYLAHLGVTHTGPPNAAGGPQVKPSMYAKYRQICRFVEILDHLLAASPLAAAPSPRIVDIGSGKGYLTFALHDHVTHRLGKSPQTLGLEVNAGLVEQCTSVATACGSQGLSFQANSAASWATVETARSIDILIALHACDTATDDAIHLGITANAGLIVCAPCCQHEIAPQLATRPSSAPATPIEGVLKYGLLKQRQADLFTDAARALLLEANGYEVRIIEFVSTEHSGKNLMIAAVRSDTVDRRAAALQYQQLATFAGYRRHRLHELLTTLPPAQF